MMNVNNANQDSVGYSYVYAKAQPIDATRTAAVDVNPSDLQPVNLQPQVLKRARENFQTSWDDFQKQKFPKLGGTNILPQDPRNLSAQANSGKLPAPVNLKEVCLDSQNLTLAETARIMFERATNSARQAQAQRLLKPGIPNDQVKAILMANLPRGTRSENYDKVDKVFNDLIVQSMSLEKFIKFVGVEGTDVMLKCKIDAYIQELRTVTAESFAMLKFGIWSDDIAMSMGRLVALIAHGHAHSAVLQKKLSTYQNCRSDQKANFQKYVELAREAIKDNAWKNS